MKNIRKQILALALIFLIGINSSSAWGEESINIDKRNSSEKKSLPASLTVVDINSDKLEYFEDKDQFVASGSARVNLKSQNSRINADRITFDQKNMLIIAEGNVVITRFDHVIHGEFARVDLTRESALMNKANTIIDQIQIKAETGNMYPEHLDLTKGSAIIDNANMNLNLSSSRDTSSSSNFINKSKTTHPADYNKKPKYKIMCKEVVINRYKDKSVITMRNAGIYLGKFKIATIPYLELSTDAKNQQNIETNLPVMGYNLQLGKYMGPSHVFYTPNGATLKVSPVFAYGTKDDSTDTSFGGGLIARYMSRTNRTQMGYTTINNKIALNGEQNLFGNTTTKLIYGSYDYFSDGIFGVVSPKAILEISDNRVLGSAYNFEFSSRESAGYAVDNTKPNFGTTKFQVQGTAINKNPILAYKKYIELRLLSQANITGYGTRDNFLMLRAGPMLNSYLGPVSLSASYLMAGLHGQSPFYFDRYVQGKQNAVFTTNWKINKYISVGSYSNINLLKDNYNNTMITANQIYTSIGPEDVKFRIGFDTVNRRSVFGFDLLLGSGNTAMNFDKLRVNEVKQ